MVSLAADSLSLPLFHGEPKKDIPDTDNVIRPKAQRLSVGVALYKGFENMNVGRLMEVMSLSADNTSA